jgi:hypothetical protein
MTEAERRLADLRYLEARIRETQAEQEEYLRRNGRIPESPPPSENQQPKRPRAHGNGDDHTGPEEAALKLDPRKPDADGRSRPNRRANDRRESRDGKERQRTTIPTKEHEVNDNNRTLIHLTDFGNARLVVSLAWQRPALVPSLESVAMLGWPALAGLQRPRGA